MKRPNKQPKAICEAVKEIMEIALFDDENHIFVEFAAHVNWIEVAAWRGAWNSSGEPEFRSIVNLFEHDEIDLESSVLLKLKTLTSDLKNL